MILKLADWHFQVEKDATWEKTTKNASDHCECGYCRNYYETIELAHPKLCSFLKEFGINVFGPSELMPFEPTLMLACYRIQGMIQSWGSEPLFVDGIQITPENDENGSFLLWIGEIELPWLQEENVEDIVSPANLPEFLERMQQVWMLRHGNEFVFS